MRDFLAAFFLALAAFVVGLALYAEPAHSHGAAQWIQDHGYKAPSGVSCCGVTDCRPIPDDDVQQQGADWVIAVRQPNGTEQDIVIPDSRFLPSDDSHFWACGLAPEWRCLFRPLMGS